METPEEELRAISEALTRLRQQQQELETRVRSLQSRMTAESVEPPVPSLPPPALPPPLPVLPEPPPVVELPPPDRPAPPALETTVGLNWINRIGVITLIFGAAFFFKYAMDNGWIGPAMRVLLGLVAAAVALVSGDRLWRRGHVVFAQGITGLGLSLCYLSCYAAASLYQLVGQPVAFGLMCVVTIGAGRLALLYESQAIAVLGMIGGYLTPPALSTGEDHPWILFSYLFLLNVGAIALAKSRPWKVLEPLAALATALLYAGWYGEWISDANRTVATVFAIAFYAQFAIGASGIWALAQLLAPLAVELTWAKDARFLPWELLFAAAGLAVAHFRNWRGAPPWTLVCFWVPYGLWISTTNVTDPVAVFGMISLAFALFFLWLPWRAFRSPEAPRATDLAVTAGNAALYFAASYSLLNPVHAQSMGLLAAGIGALHLALGWRLTNAHASQFTVGVALAFVTLAVPIQFAGFRVTMAWAMEGAALAWLAARFGDSWLRAATAGVLALAMLRLMFSDVWAYWNTNEFAVLGNARFLAFLVTAAALWLTAKFLSSAIAYIPGHVVMLFGLSLELGAWVRRTVAVEDQSSVQNVAISILMTVYAVMLVTLGVATRTVLNRILGLGLVGLVVAKLYLLDVWVVGRVFRITAFLALGVLLLVVSFLYSRFKPNLDRLWKA